MDRYAVVILNWNGPVDTVECVKSIALENPSATPIIIDNGSSDNSVQILRSALIEIYGGLIEESTETTVSVLSDRVNILPILVVSNINTGFSRGCNIGLKLASLYGYKNTVFLNNDTVVEADALERIVGFLNKNTEYFVTLPRLMVHKTDFIWNCGGKISKLGFRKYYHCGDKSLSTNLRSSLECTFFTGCCFAIETNRFMNRGGFSERFFFGEEDFELCLWMADSRLKAVCLTDAVVHHKVSAAVVRASALGQGRKVFVHYLNRFIHMRLRFGTAKWLLWSALYAPYIAIILARNEIVPVRDLPSFISCLLRRARSKDSVGKTDFESIMLRQPW